MIPASPWRSILRKSIAVVVRQAGPPIQHLSTYLSYAVVRDLFDWKEAPTEGA
jgi:hypothetical protein